MKKNYKIAIIFAIVIIAIGYLIWQKDPSGQSGEIAEDNSRIIFFYGQECPHCHDVEEYIAAHEIDKKVEFSKREVYHDKPNANLFLKKGEECNLGEKEIGAVPMLWADGKCYVGVNEVENLLIKEADKNETPLPAENNNQ